MATKKELQDKKELAKAYYLQGEAQKNIALKLSVSQVTVSRWAKDGNWSKLKAGKSITRTELVNKNLELISILLESATDSKQPAIEAARISDQISKLAASIERLDKKTNVVNEIDSFMNFNNWLQKRISFDKSLNQELIKAINKFQDIYVSEKMSKN